jgi:EAL domain-containing protein (putative c-di-GMP-specific phosphodiesterase class I)
MSEIMDLARSSCFPLDRLTLEITESAIMVDPEHGKSVLIKLHEAGIRFSMDDFGIGHSSLGYLKDLPITQLKIDKSFVIGFSEPRNAAIVHAALEMGHNLGMHVTAEGIEDEATFLALRDLGCDTGQGFFFSKPLPPDKFSTWLRTSTWKLPRLETIGRMDV